MTHAVVVVHEQRMGRIGSNEQLARQANLAHGPANTHFLSYGRFSGIRLPLYFHLYLSRISISYWDGMGKWETISPLMR